ncbi:MAG: carboxypeptidase M32 [Firmicutes bacterium]|nr:carboxypeptidase M32 [Bacillota bacterium]
MSSKKTEAEFRDLLAKLHAFRHALAILSYDAETIMPAAGAEAMGETCGLLAEEQQKLLTSPQLKELLAAVQECGEQMPKELQAEAAELRRQQAKMEAISPAEYREYNTLQAHAVQVWKDAKQQEDFAAFQPYLEKLIDYNRRFALSYDKNTDVYDTLLDDNDRGLNRAELDPFFDQVARELSPLIREIAGQKAPEDDFLQGNFPVETQRQLSSRIMEILGIDRQRCALGETEHPFTEGMNNRDVRVTTHYYEEDLTNSLYSVIHECGHALYMLNVDDKLNGLSIGEGASTAMHESQSRLFENMVGRSRDFLHFLLPELKQLFPSLDGVSEEAFYRAVNLSKPSLIRITADELSYPLHVLIRYELEKSLFAGDLQVGELPQAWDDLYEKYLGLRPDRLSTGVLQDTHWASGLFGYFPGYALGSAYAAQFFHSMQKELDIPGDLRSGNLEPLCQWLREKVWRLGALLQPREILQAATGEGFDPSYYICYLQEKYKEIYRI